MPKMKIRGMNIWAISFIPHHYLCLFFSCHENLIESERERLVSLQLFEKIVEGWVQRFDFVFQKQIMVTYKSEECK